MSNRKNFPDKLIRNLSNNHVNSIGHGAGIDENADSQIAIDPLSQVCSMPDNAIRCRVAHTTLSYSTSSSVHIPKT